MVDPRETRGNRIVNTSTGNPTRETTTGVPELSGNESRLSRRRLLSNACLGMLGGLVTGAWPGRVEADDEKFGPVFPFDDAALVRRAEKMSKLEYAPPPLHAPDIIEKIDYDAHGKIRFDPTLALNGDGPGLYPSTFFHVGRYFQTGVRIFRLAQGGASEVLYLPDLFSMPDDSPAKHLPSDIGFAGFRFHEARSREDWRTQDWMAFLGASYFRAIGDLGQYGLSSRGIAIDSATPSAEEFPLFREFYIETAQNPDDPTTVLALLEGPSVVGAYRFQIRRTRAVIVDVEARLFLRRDVQRLGIAPITSMFWYGENTPGVSTDWRPEIHDSDGLMVWTGAGERLWRPLVNPRLPTVSSFVDENPRGFGLLQRDRVFDNYLDGVRYDLRPSLWIEPLGSWGRGSVQLMELRTDDEVHDNIGAFWVPEEPARAGNTYNFRYRQHWSADPPTLPGRVARCISTRLGRGGQPGQTRPQGVRKFVVEFADGPLVDLTHDVRVDAAVGAAGGEVIDPVAEQVPGTKRWRCVFDVRPSSSAPVELRAYLRASDETLTETWLYRYDPEPRD